MSTSKTIVLQSSDGETLEVEELVALASQTIKHMIEDNCADPSTPLPNVTSKILAKVIEYCKQHVDNTKAEDKTAEDELKNFDVECVKVDRGILFLSKMGFNWVRARLLISDHHQGPPREILLMKLFKTDDYLCRRVLVYAVLPSKLCHFMIGALGFTLRQCSMTIFN